MGVLLFHGFATTTSEVRLIAESFHACGYTIAAPLLPGHGTTPQEMNRCRWQEWVEMAEMAYFDLSHQCERVFVGGESMGGLLALYLSSCHPELAGVLSYAPALQVTSKKKPWVAWALAPWIPFSEKPPSSPSPADARWQGYRVRPVHAAVELFRLQRAVRGRLSQIKVPLLVVQGERDYTVSPDVPAILARETDACWTEIRWLGASGHCVLLDAEWERAAALGLRFMERALAECE